MKVSEIFYSVQGEGLNIGMPQIFVRLYGCNLRCSWCDSKYAMEGEYEELTPARIMTRIEQWPCKAVCITGGEPLVQRDELFKLLKLLRQWNYYVQIFTNGTIVDRQIFDFCDFISMDMKPPSSGMKGNLDLLTVMHNFHQFKFEIKVVVQDEKDLEFALRKVYPKFDGTLIIQPCVTDPTKELKLLQELTKKILRYNLKDIRVLPQLHKLIWPKEWRGK